MNVNLFNKQYLNKKVKLDKNTPNKEEEMLLNLWNSGTEEERIKFAYTLLDIARDTNK